MRYLHIVPIGLAWAQRERLQREAAAHPALAQIRVHQKTRKQADDGKSVGSSSRRRLAFYVEGTQKWTDGLDRGLSCTPLTLTLY